MKNKPSQLTMPAEAERVFDHINRAQPLRDQIYAMIRSMILTGVLPPGGPLEEKAIATRLGVSRTPVREAVQKLGDEHLIEIKPQSGTRVANISRSHVHQAYLIRRALESETVAAAAANMAAKDETRLEGNFLQHRLALEREQYVEAIGFDDEFHRIVADIADLPLLWRAITIFKAQLDRCRHQTLPMEGYGESTLTQHQAILDALKKHDEKQAREMMQSHLDQTYKGVQEFLNSVSNTEKRALLS